MSDQLRQAWDGFGDGQERQPRPPYIKRTREGKYYRTEDGAKSDIGPAFDAVVLHTRLERSWFADGRLTCKAVQVHPGEAMTITGRNPPAPSCAECPQNNRNGGACKPQRKFVLLPVSNGKLTSKPYVFYGSGMSLVPWSDYEAKLHEDEQLPPQAAVTRFGNEDYDTSSFGIVKAASFAFRRWLDVDEAKVVQARMGQTTGLMPVPDGAEGPKNAAGGVFDEGVGQPPAPAQNDAQAAQEAADAATTDVTDEFPDESLDDVPF